MRPLKHYGLTLIELLVVLAILGALATGIVPVAGVLLKKVQSDNIQLTLIQSWRLALARAQVMGQPIVWQIQANETSATIHLLDAQAGIIWTTTLNTCSLQVRGHGQPSSTARLLVYPHGLSPTREIHWQVEGKDQSITLPPDLSETPDSNSPE